MTKRATFARDIITDFYRAEWYLDFTLSLIYLRVGSLAVMLTH